MLVRIMVDNSMAEMVVSGCEKLDAQLSDLDAVLDMVSIAIASPEASLHLREVNLMLHMSRRMVSMCRDLNAAEGRSIHPTN